VTLTGSEGVWEGTDPVDVSSVWLRCDPDGTNCNVIPGAAGPSYTLGPTDVNRTLRLRVSSSSAGGQATTDTLAGGEAAALLTGLAVRPRAFRRRARVWYVLDRPSSVRFKVQRKVRKRWRRVKGSFTHAGAAGANSRRFSGRLRGRALRPGRYRLLATPSGGLTARAGFRILPG
jgi:hypothetical protein